MAEDQLGPKSPIVPLVKDHDALMQTHEPETSISMRIRPGTKSADMLDLALIDPSDVTSPQPPCKQLLTRQNDKSYQYASEQLKAVYNAAVHPDGLGSTVRIDRDMALRLAVPPQDVDKSLWLYELSRLLIQQVNTVVIALFANDPPCSAETCAEMRASEWQYLCAAHDPPKACVPIDYCCHMLDWAANLLTSQKAFARRMITSDHEAGEKSASMKQLINIMRRVYRIFAHTWFQHRDTFWKLESRTGLYVFFKTVCDTYDLISTEQSIIPAEAEAGEPAPPSESRDSLHANSEAQAQERAPALIISPGLVNAADYQNAMSSAPAPTSTTKRHRQTLSTDSDTIATVLEEAEEEYQHVPAHPSLGENLQHSEPHLPEPHDTLSGLQAEPALPEEEEEPSVHVVGVTAVDGDTTDHQTEALAKQTEALAIDAPQAPLIVNVEHEEHQTEKEPEPVEKHDPEPAGPDTTTPTAVTKAEAASGDAAKTE
jgi:hypothetical protein